MRLRGFVFGLLVVAMLAAIPASANAEIVYTHGQTSPPASGTWVPSTLWAMNDDGSGPHQILTAAQAPSKQQAVCCASLQPNSSTALFEGFDYQYSGNAAGGYGDYYEGMYVLSGGTVIRLSPQPAAAPGQSRYDAPAVLTENGKVIFQRQTAEYEAGSPGTQDGAAWSMDEEPAAGGALSPWLWVGDNGVNSFPGSNPSFPPSTFASDPADPSLVAYSGGGQLYIDNQGNTGAVDVASQPSAYANAGLAWSPDGSELADVDNTLPSNVGTPGADGYSPGLWEFSASASGAHHLVLADPSDSTFTSPVFVGQNEIAFDAENNIWEVPASCNACSFPSGAKQLTTDGTNSVPDYAPSWTSHTVGGTTRTTRKLKVTVTASPHQKVIKQKGLIEVIKCNITCAFDAFGQIQIAGTHKAKKSKSVARALRGGASRKVTLGLSKSTLQAIRSALAHHKTVIATVAAEAADIAGQTSHAKKAFRVRS